MEPKPGYKTSEFWLSLAAVVVSYVISADVLGEGTVQSKAIMIVATVLAALGYTASRAIVKSSSNKKE
jgi:hypothetical protein